MTLPRDSRRTSYHAEIRLPRRLVAAWAFTTAAPALLANTLAPAFGVGLMGALSPHSGPMGVYLTLLSATFVSAGPAGLAAWAQSLVWETTLRDRPRWAWPTAAGYLGGWILSLMLAFPLVVAFLSAHGLARGEPAPPAVIGPALVQYGALTGAVLGLISSGAQAWALFRWRASVPMALTWLLVGVVAWALQGTTFWVVYLGAGGPLCQGWDCLRDPRAGPQPSLPLLIVAWIAASGVVGLLTGLAFARIMQDERHAAAQVAGTPEGR